MRLLDQCLFIFDKDQNLNFSNFDEQPFKQLMGKHYAMLNVTSIVHTSKSCSLTSLFSVPEKYELKVQPESLSLILTILNILKERRVIISCCSLPQLINSIKAHIAKSRNPYRTQRKHTAGTGITGARSIGMESHLSSRPSHNIIVSNSHSQNLTPRCTSSTLKSSWKLPASSWTSF